MSYQRKTKDRWDIMTNWGYGWECENSEYTRADAKRSLKEYRENLAGREGPVARITVCLCDPTLAENEAYVDTNNCPWVVNFLETKGLAKSTGRMRRSGYCTYPAMKFDREKMEEFEGGC